jgi:hypothetical protein
LNTNILNKEVQQFIQANLKSDITKLILKGSPFQGISIQEIAEQILSKNKCEKKLPTWFKTNNIFYPNKLNIAQTSSEITAKYKASLVSGNSLIDITGGFGVDAYYFSQKVKNVTHCEINDELSKIVTHNIKQFHVKNMETVISNGLQYLEKTTLKYNWIYADPSRRNDLKGKVFLLEDCLPNIPENLDLLFEKSDHILLKISPLLDITSAINELKFVKEIHVVAVNNEMKEVLFVLEKNYNQQIKIKTINFNKTKTQHFDFVAFNESFASFSEPKKYIYEPNVAILKSGGFNQVSEQLKLDKLHQHSHLYTSENLIEFPGRSFEIIQVIPYNKKELLKIIPNKKANITTRNFPVTVAEIRKKTKFKEGGNNYLFFTTDINNQYIVVVCKKV